MESAIESKTFAAPDGSPYILYYRPDQDAFHVEVSKNGGKSSSARLCFDFCRPQDTFFDIGVNIGTVSVPIATKGTNVYGFELLQENFSLLEKAIGANQFSAFHAYHTAVSNSAGLLYGRGTSAWAQACDSGEPADAVESITIDQFVEDHKIGGIDLMKIDVEGHENRVLQGAQNAIDRFHPAIVIEVNVLTCGRNGYSSKSLLTGLASQGYSFYRIHQRFLEPASPQSWQETFFCDYLCVADESVSQRLDWPVRSRERDEVVAAILREETYPQVHRDYVVVAAEHAPEEIRRDPIFREKVSQWSESLIEDGLEDDLRVGVGMDVGADRSDDQ